MSLRRIYKLVPQSPGSPLELEAKPSTPSIHSIDLQKLGIYILSGISLLLYLYHLIIAISLNISQNKYQIPLTTMDWISSCLHYLLITAGLASHIVFIVLTALNVLNQAQLYFQISFYVNTALYLLLQIMLVIVLFLFRNIYTKNLVFAEFIWLIVLYSCFFGVSILVSLLLQKPAIRFALPFYAIS